MNITKISDEMLVEQLRNGTRRSMGYLEVRHMGFVRNYIMRKVRDYDRAEELTQLVRIRALDYISSGKYVSKGKFRPWLYTIATSQILDFYKRESRRVVSFYGDNEPSVCDDSVEESERQNDLDYWLLLLEKFILSLPSDQQSVVQKRLEGKSFDEIAREESCSINTALGRMRYAIKNLRVMFGHYAA